MHLKLVTVSKGKKEFTGLEEINSSAVLKKKKIK